jgi:hypothetical protein
VAGCLDSGGALTVMMIVAGLWHGEAESHKGDARAISSGPEGEGREGQVPPSSLPPPLVAAFNYVYVRE